MERITQKTKKLALGFMSGTSLDGMDAALVEIEGAGLSVKMRFIDFFTLPYNDELRAALMDCVLGGSGGSRLVNRLNVILGEIAAEAGLELCRKNGIETSEIDFAGNHGQTVFHEPKAEAFCGHNVRGTLQIGEDAVIAEKLNCVVAGDFRVRDMAAGGEGAPLVPYTEYLLYRKKDRTAAFLNIGGIGNITFLKADCGVDDIIAFDTGPGCMIIDAALRELTGRAFDEGGGFARKGRVCASFIEWMLALDTGFLECPPPKSTGREYYNAAYMKRLLEKAAKLELSTEDCIASVTYYTAKTIAIGVERFCPPAGKEPPALYVSGGGSNNAALMQFIKELLPRYEIRHGDDLGIPAKAKEACAFALLANEAIHGLCNNAPSATGAHHPVVMGKISF